MRGVEALSAVDSRRTAAVIADQLRESIIDGAFAPGDQVNEALAASRLDVSRGPVREALQRLVQEGLLIARPNRGVFVRGLDERGVAEVFAAREAIECAAAAIVTSRDSGSRQDSAAALAAVVDREQAAFEAGDSLRLGRLDLEFHSTLVQDARNSRLDRAFATLATESLICRTHLPDACPESSAVVPAHRELVELVRTGSTAALRAALRALLSTDGRPATSKADAVLRRT